MHAHDITPEDSQLDVCVKDGWYSSQEAAELQEELDDINMDPNPTPEMVRRRDTLLRGIEREYQLTLKWIGIRRTIVCKCLCYGATTEEIETADTHRTPWKIYDLLSQVQRRYEKGLVGNV